MFPFMLNIGLFAISAAHAEVEAHMKDGQTRKCRFPAVKGLQTKRTKFGHRWILTERCRDGKAHSVTVPISDGDSLETFRRKVDEAHRALQQRDVGSFEEMLERFLESRMLSKTTRDGYGYALAGFSFDNERNDEAMRSLLARPIKKSTKATYVEKIGSFFTWAIAHGADVKNPTIDVRIRGAASARQRIMTDSEIARVMKYASKKEPMYRLFILLLIHTGARASSVLAIRGSDMTENGLRLYNVKCRRYYDYPIPITNGEILSALSAAGSGEIFGKNGVAYHKRLNCWMGRTFPPDERGEKLSVHSFRHTFASRAAQNDVPLAVVSKLLDHQSVATTAKFYARFSREQIADAVAKAVKDFPT